MSDRRAPLLAFFSPGLLVLVALFAASKPSCAEEMVRFALTEFVSTEPGSTFRILRIHVLKPPIEDWACEQTYLEGARVVAFARGESTKTRIKRQACLRSLPADLSGIERGERLKGAYAVAFKKRWLTRSIEWREIYFLDVDPGPDAVCSDLTHYYQQQRHVYDVTCNPPAR